MYENFLDNIWRIISRLYNQTRYVIDLNGYFSHCNGISVRDEKGILKKEIRHEFMELLKNEYPGCKVEYMETKSSYNENVLESVIIIDWTE